MDVGCWLSHHLLRLPTLQDDDDDDDDGGDDDDPIGVNELSRQKQTLYTIQTCQRANTDPSAYSREERRRMPCTKCKAQSNETF